VVVNGWKQSGGYDVETGKELWRLTGGGDIPTPTPVGANGLIVLTSAHGDQRPIYAIKESARGDITEQKDAFAWRQDRAGNYMQTPVVVDGIGYFCNDNGILSAYQMSTGERLYQQRLAQGNSGFSASAVAAGGRLYVTSEEGVTHVIALGPKFQELGKNELGETVMATPAVVGEMIYFRGRGRVWGVGGR
ncbi:MAG: PQQ-like beta-propeller repeat protein, partial [Bdellovibrionales bacterium]|nr:PQQ-like beta-propeller repeat protein [Bdellovibrionales bacterium]